MEQRKTFCASMGWTLETRLMRGEPHKKARIVGKDGGVLMGTGGNYLSGYVDGLMDGLLATPFERAYRTISSRKGGGGE